MKRASRKSLLDSSALLAFLQRESGFEKVRSLFQAARRLREPLLMNEVNIGEVYHITAKRYSRETAEQFLHRLKAFPIQPIPNNFSEVLEAARIKARFPISYGDAFVVATAIRTNAAIVTGDPEFEAVADLVPIDWLRT